MNASNLKEYSANGVPAPRAEKWQPPARKHLRTTMQIARFVATCELRIYADVWYNVYNHAYLNVCKIVYINEYIFGYFIVFTYVYNHRCVHGLKHASPNVYNVITLSVITRGGSKTESLPTPHTFPIIHKIKNESLFIINF